MKITQYGLQYFVTVTMYITFIGSSVVEKIADVNMVALDKTGTLTKGQFKVMNRKDLKTDLNDDSDVFDPDGQWEELLEAFHPMECAVSLEEKSTHPLAACIMEG